MEKTFQSVQQIIGDLFDLDADDVRLETSRDDVEKWDSLQHVNLILDIESHFNVHFSEEQVAQMRSVKQLVDQIEAKRKQATPLI